MTTIRHAVSLFALLLTNCEPIRASDCTQSPNNFLHPPSQERPKFRYWLPDASVDAGTVEADIKAAGDIGAGGVEFLPFYNYGGDLGPAPAGVNWSTYGFGTPAHLNLFTSALKAHEQAGLTMDFSLGPNQGQGIPAHPDDEGLQWDLVSFSQAVSNRSFLNETIPGWGDGELVAVVSAVVVSRANISYNIVGITGSTTVSYQDLVLENGSLTDITSSVSGDGILSWKPARSLPSGSDHELFFFYEKLSLNQNVHFPSNTTKTIWDNGSYIVDHFSAQGARTVQTFWEQYLLTDELKGLLRDVGNYGWEDSIEIPSNVSWTRSLPTRFQGMFAYDLKPYLPLIMFSNNNINLQSTSPGTTRCTLDRLDQGKGYVNDYREALAAGYQEYLATLSQWLQSLEVKGLSSQPSYNLPMDMEASIPFVDAPECESLQGHDNIDGYRQFSGPANLARKKIVSIELGAVFGKAYSYTIPELLFAANRAVAGGVNQFVIHGQSYTGNYPQTTWPGYTAFIFYVSDLYSPKRPDWKYGLQAALSYMSRLQHIQQQGVPRADIAFYNKQSATDPNFGTVYAPTDLIDEGWSYTYLSPDNFDMPNAYVEHGMLAPQDAAYQAMVILGSQNLTQLSITKLESFVKAGLPIIVAGSVPGLYPSRMQINTGHTPANNELIKFLNNTNVHHVAEGEISQKLNELSLKPRVGVRTNGTWYSTWREDKESGIAYAYIFGDLVAATGEVVVQSKGIPYFFDLWTGARQAVLNYRTNGSSTIIPLELAGNQTMVIAFADKAIRGTITPAIHATQVSSNIVSYGPVGDGIGLHVVASSDPAFVTSSTGNKITHFSQAPDSFELGPWTLVLEHWEAPENFSDATITAVKSNTTHQLNKLVSWSDLPYATNTSGVGYYSTNFTWPPESTTSSAHNTSLGAYIKFPPVLNAITVYVNGARLPPLDSTNPTADATSYLVKGNNHVVAVVPGTMWNYLRSILPEIRSSGREFSSMVALPKTDNGLIGIVAVVPFEIVLLKA
ncbi:hypothetical protein CPAR01_03388 [Colletotrichum paranaense]|uniref:Secreted protein n=1 Tax=Colletotrichum paranaense TaxID=1914294 RepID=A0ABQ9T423_9PEZI|nr:uncharacterized protein CPAR01_03388 [Colletotrichum paranaense]KAK1545886.1 hypothetical protein CPAR01_03388 [Colletotrichum paranaense]